MRNQYSGEKFSFSFAECALRILVGPRACGLNRRRDDSDSVANLLCGPPTVLIIIGIIIRPGSLEEVNPSLLIGSSLVRISFFFFDFDTDRFY